MSQADSAPPRLALRELIAEATGFSREAWRDCWLVMLLLALVHTYIFARGHIALSTWRASPLDWIAPLGLVFYAPLYGGLYRVALGGPMLQELGPGGLQWKGLEWRLIMVGAAIGVLIAMVAAPFMLVNLIAILLLGVHAQISLGPLGGWARWAPATAVIWLIFLWLMAPRIARLMLGWAYSSARERFEPLAGWEPAKSSGWTLALSLTLAMVPLLLGWLGLHALTLLEPDTLAGEYWPVPEALGVGLLLGVLKAAVVAPLSAGVLAGAWWLMEGRREVAPAAPPPPPPDWPRFRANPFAPTVTALASATPDDDEDRSLETGEGSELNAVREETAGSLEQGAPSPPVIPTDADTAGPEAAPVAPETIPILVTPKSEASPGEAAGAAPQPTPSGGGRLSIWPHSALPPWPLGVKEPEASPTPGVEPLASGPEPAHPSKEISERD